MKYDLAIAHRVCPALSATAVGFSSKLEMVRATANSLAVAIRGFKVKIFLILDGCPYEYERLFSDVFSQPLTETSPGGMEIVRTPSIGNQATWRLQIEKLLSVDDAEFLYFSEDDYIYDESAFRVMIDFMRRNSDVDFVSPLDHPDRYRNNINESRQVTVKVSPYCHWREVSTTCLTFMMRQGLLSKVRRTFDTYSNGNLDSTMWLGLTKDGVFDFPRMVWSMMSHILGLSKDYGKLLQLAAWKWHGLRLLTNRKCHLWSPLPTLAVHLSSSSLPLTADRIVGISGCDNEIRGMMLSHLGLGNVVEN